MKKLVLLFSLSLTTSLMAGPVETLNEAVTKLNRIERKLENLKTQAGDTRSLIYDAIYEMQQNNGPQITCSTQQSGRTLSATAATKEEAIGKLMKKCVALNVAPNVCRMNIRYNMQCY